METPQITSNTINFPKIGRKKDRHKLDPKVRGKKWRREKALIQELKKRNFTLLNNNPNFFKNWWHGFSPQAYILIVNREFFFFVGEGQKSYEFAYQWRKHNKEIEDALKNKPLLFRKKLKQLDLELKVVKEHWREHVDIIETINKVPQTPAYNQGGHYEKRDLSCLLLKNGEAGGKNRTTLDFDFCHKNERGGYLFSETKRVFYHKKAIYLIKWLKLPWYEISPSGGIKIHLNLNELLARSKIYHYDTGKVLGDVLGVNSQTILPISQGRKIVFTKYAKYSTKLPLIKVEELKKLLVEKFFLVFSKEKVKSKVITNMPSEAKETNKTISQIKGQKTIIHGSQILGKEMLPRRGQKPLYKINYLHRRKKRYCLLDTYQQKREKDLVWLFNGDIKDFVINQGNSHQFFYGFV